MTVWIVVLGVDVACFISSTPPLTLPAERRQEEEIEWRRNESDREEENKNNDNKRKHQLEPENIISSADQHWATAQFKFQDAYFNQAGLHLLDLPVKLACLCLVGSGSQLGNPAVRTCQEAADGGKVCFMRFGDVYISKRRYERFWQISTKLLLRPNNECLLRNSIIITCKH